MKLNEAKEIAEALTTASENLNQMLVAAVNQGMIVQPEITTIAGQPLVKVNVGVKPNMVAND